MSTPDPTLPATTASNGPDDYSRLGDMPVRVSAIVGRTRIGIGELLKLQPGSVLELDRRVGEAVDIQVNGRTVGRGEIVMIEDRLGVTMTEILNADD